MSLEDRLTQKESFQLPRQPSGWAHQHQLCVFVCVYVSRWEKERSQGRQINFCSNLRAIVMAYTGKDTASSVNTCVLRYPGWRCHMGVLGCELNNHDGHAMRIGAAHA